MITFGSELHGVGTARAGVIFGLVRAVVLDVVDGLD